MLKKQNRKWRCTFSFVVPPSKFCLRLYRIIIVVRLRSQIFRQIVYIECRQAGACQAKFAQDGGKYASKRAAKAKAVNYAVLPLIIIDYIVS